MLVWVIEQNDIGLHPASTWSLNKGLILWMQDISEIHPLRKNKTSVPELIFYLNWQWAKALRSEPKLMGNDSKVRFLLGLDKSSKTPTETN